MVSCRFSQIPAIRRIGHQVCGAGRIGDDDTTGVRAPGQRHGTYEPARLNLGQPPFPPTEGRNEPQLVSASITLAAKESDPAAVRRPQGAEVGTASVVSRKECQRRSAGRRCPGRCRLARSSRTRPGYHRVRTTASVSRRQRQERHGPQRRHAVGGWRRLPRGVGGDKEKWHRRRPDPAPAPRRSRGWNLGRQAGSRIRREVFERHLQVRHRLKAPGGISAKAAQDGALHVQRNDAVSVPGGAASSLRIFASTARFESRERPAAGHHLVQKGAETENVRARVHRRPSACSATYTPPFRRPFPLRSTGRSASAPRLHIRGIEELRQPEVEDFHTVRLVGDDDVRWLQVPVNDSCCMSGCQRIGNRTP